MPDSRTRTISLKVMSALRGDVGKPCIRLARQSRDAIGVVPGDSVGVAAAEGKVALVVHKADAEMVGATACRLDGGARKALGVAVGDTVQVSATELSRIDIRATIDPRHYDIVVVERGAENPFQISGKLACIALRQTAEAQTPLTKAKAIFGWVLENIEYGDHRPANIGYRDSVETKIAGEGVCGEMAFLYVAMARVAGLVASFVLVDRDHRGKDVNHACAGVRIDTTLILADPAYQTFDIQHRKIRVLSDLEAHAAFRSMRARGPVSVHRTLQE